MTKQGWGPCVLDPLEGCGRGDFLSGQVKFVCMEKFLERWVVVGPGDAQVSLSALCLGIPLDGADMGCQ